MKTNLMQYKAVRKPLVAIILSIRSACFTVERSKFDRDGVGPSPKEGEGAEPACSL